MVFLILRDLTQQIFDSQQWETVLVRKIKGKPRSFKAYLCGSLYFTCAFHKKRFQKLFKDHLARSKATCPFKVRHFMCKLRFYRMPSCTHIMYTIHVTVKLYFGGVKSRHIDQYTKVSTQKVTDNNKQTAIFKMNSKLIIPINPWHCTLQQSSTDRETMCF